MEQNINETRTVKYYCPLLVQMEIDKYEEHNDGSDWLEPCDGVRYLSEIQDAIDLDCYRTMKGKGLMEYFTDNENISTKVSSAFPGVEIIDGVIYGVMVTKQNENLLVDEEEQFIEYMSGQFSDGYVPKNNMRRSRPKSWLIPTLMALSSSHIILQTVRTSLEFEKGFTQREITLYSGGFYGKDSGRTNSRGFEGA